MPLAGRFTPAGPDHAQVAAVNGVIDYLEAVARHHGHGDAPVPAQAAAVRQLFRASETARLQPLLDFLAAHPKVRLIGSTGPNRARRRWRSPSRDTRPPTWPADWRSAASVSASGNFYAYRLVQALGIDPSDGVVRTSFVHYTTDAEVERLVAALDALLR